MTSPTLRARCLLVLFLALTVSLPGWEPARASTSVDRQGELSARRAPADRLQLAKAHPERIILKFKPTTSPSARANLRRQERLEKVRELGLIRAEVTRVTGRSPEDAVRSLERRADVEYASLDYVRRPSGYADEPRFGEQWGHHNTGQKVKGIAGTTDVDVSAPEATLTTLGDPSLVVAVIDDGVDFSHPDLSGQQWVNAGESGTDALGRDRATNGVDDDGNGYLDDATGWDFCHDDNTVHDPVEADAHGTHVAGVIAASVNGKGIAGMSPGIKVMALKFLGPGCGYDSAAVAAIEYAKSKGAKIVNVSWGGPYYSQPLKDAIDGSGMFFSAAAGNEGSWVYSYPAAYDSPNVLSVAAAMNRGYLAGSSNYGSDWVDVAAPGEGILSTLPAVPARSALTLSFPGTGRAVVTGFGLEEINGGTERAGFVQRAFTALERGSEPVVLVDDDGSHSGLARYPDVGATISTAIQSITGQAPEVIPVGNASGPALAQLEGKVVVWATGKAWSSGDGWDTNLTVTDQVNLRSFLEGGGKLLITGTDALLFIEDRFFPKDVLGLHVLSDAGLDERGRRHLNGLAGTAYEGQSYDVSTLSTADPLFHDVLLPALGSATVTLGNYVSAPATYASWDGTSMAAPYATGVAALTASVRPGLLGDLHAFRTLLTYGAKPLPGTVGKTISGKMVDARAAITASAEATPPTGTISHESGVPQYTNKTSIPVRLAASDPEPGSGVAYMRLSNDGAAWSAWERFAPTKTWTLSAGDGPKTVYAQYRDAAGNQSAVSSFSVLLDTTPPVARAPVQGIGVPSQLGTSAVPVRLSWSGSDGSGAGIYAYRLEKSINGGTWRQVFLATQSATSITPAHSPGGSTYQYRVRSADRANNWGAWSYGRSFRVTASQETSSAIAYSGSWTRVAVTGSYGGYVRHASVKGSRARYTFTGRNVAWATTKAPDRGKADVYLDGAYVSTVNLYSSTTLTRQVVFSRGNLDPKLSHTIEVRVRGDKQAASKGTRVDVDAFVNLDNGAPIIQPPTPGLVAYSTLTESSIPVSQRWSGRDDSCGPRALVYDVQQRAKTSDVWGGWTWVAQGTSSTSLTRQLAPGSYQYQVRAPDCAGKRSAWRVGKEFNVSWQPETTANATYDGPWTSGALSGAGGGSVLYGTSHYSHVSYVIPGPSVALVAVKGPNRGQAWARVGGGEVTTLDLYSPVIQTRQVVYVRNGVNTTYDNPLSVSVITSKNEASTGTRVDKMGSWYCGSPR